MVKRVILALVAVVAVVVVIAVVRSDADKPPEPPEVRTTGPWVDGILISRGTSAAAAVRELEAGDIDIWWTIPITDPGIYSRIVEHPGIRYDISYGSYTELMFNVAGPYFHDGRLNPFSDAEIREAFNWLVDRDYVVGELLGGMGTPIYALEGMAFTEYARYPDIFEAIEDYYAHDPDRAKNIIHDRMLAMGAELEGQTWRYNGDEITINFIIRTDLFPPLYPAGGDYLADLMEWVGFKVDRMYLPLSAASSIWMLDDPFTGTYNAVVAGWALPALPRDQGDRCYVSDTKDGRQFARWVALDPPEEYRAVAEQLYGRDYATLAEREELFEQALWMRMKYSPQVLLADIGGANPWRSSLNLCTDLSSGFGWGAVQTVHFVDEDGKPVVGGTLTGQQYEVFVKPWNPVDGSAAVADLIVLRGMLQEAGLMTDGRDGLLHPWRIDAAAVTVVTGLPVQKNHDWLTLDFVDDIQAPADAWVDWDAETQRFITVGEKTDSGSPYHDPNFDPSASVKSVVYYPNDIYELPMHDGSTLSLADFIMAMIIRFDRAKEKSAVYDEAEVRRLRGFMANSRGVKIVSEDPLVIESYTTLWNLDAEANVAPWFPAYGFYGQFAPWHVITIGMMAESDLSLAWGAEKSSTLMVEWMDYTKGPSLPILRGYLDDAIADNYVPYQPTLGDYISAADAAERYANLKTWDAKVGHLWTTTAPFYLHSVQPLAGIIELRRFEDHPDPIDRWMFLLDDL